MPITFPIELPVQRTVIVVIVVFSIFAILAVILRLRSMRIAKRALNGSDYCIIAACHLVARADTRIPAVLIGGAGFHFSQIVAKHGSEPITIMLKILMPVQFLWATSLSLVKISLLILYARVFPTRPLIIAAWANGCVIVAWAMTTILLGFFICRPFAFNWDQGIPNGTCGNQVLSYQITGAMNLVTDVVTLVLPIPHLIKLQMPLYRKIVLQSVFALGIVTCITSLLRLVSLGSLDYSDITYNIPDALIFGGLEPLIGIIVACVPLMRPLLGRSTYSATGTAAQTQIRTEQVSKCNIGKTRRGV
ncbi:integral membrane protein [Apiospora arundinis]